MLKGSILICLISGLNWCNGTNAGPWALYARNSRSNTNAYVGVCLDSNQPDIAIAKTGYEGDVFLLGSKRNRDIQRFLVTKVKISA